MKKQLRVTISGPQGAGKSYLGQQITEMLRRHPLYKDRSVCNLDDLNSNSDASIVIFTIQSEEKRRPYTPGPRQHPLFAESTYGDASYFMPLGRQQSVPGPHTCITIDDILSEPANWPKGGPRYNSVSGWEFEKAEAIRSVKTKLVISWLNGQNTFRHKLIADRLKEIAL